MSYGLTLLGFYLMVTHPFLSEVLITTVHEGVHRHKGVIYNKVEPENNVEVLSFILNEMLVRRILRIFRQDLGEGDEVRC